MTKLLPAGSFKSVETMHSAQMTALTNEMMSMEFELDVLRRRTAEAQKELEVANARLVLCWFFGYCLFFAKLCCSLRVAEQNGFETIDQNTANKILGRR